MRRIVHLTTNMRSLLDLMNLQVIWSIGRRPKGESRTILQSHRTNVARSLTGFVTYSSCVPVNDNSRISIKALLFVRIRATAGWRS